MAFVISLMNNEKSNGPKSESCTTPEVTGKISDARSLIHIHYLRSLRWGWDIMRVAALVEKLYWRNSVEQSSKGSTLSKALEKSNRTSKETSLSSLAMSRLIVIFKRAVVVLWLDLKPDWSQFIIPFCSMYVVICLRMIISTALDKETT
jgi:hypothetical protein